MYTAKISILIVIFYNTVLKTFNMPVTAFSGVGAEGGKSGLSRIPSVGIGRFNDCDEIPHQTFNGLLSHGLLNPMPL